MRVWHITNTPLDESVNMISTVAALGRRSLPCSRLEGPSLVASPEPLLEVSGQYLAQRLARGSVRWWQCRFSSPPIGHGTGITGNLTSNSDEW